MVLGEGVTGRRKKSNTLLRVSHQAPLQIISSQPFQENCEAPSTNHLTQLIPSFEALSLIPMIRPHGRYCCIPVTLTWTKGQGTSSRSPSWRAGLFFSSSIHQICSPKDVFPGPMSLSPASQPQGSFLCLLAPSPPWGGW